jgi:tRNA dimethylallyltransferase
MKRKVDTGAENTKKPKVIIIQGPTGVGKTDIALSLAMQYPLEIVNADSMQVYRLLDVGTSKPTSAQQEAVPHHLFSIIDPNEQFSAAQFKERAREVIAQIASRGFVPLLVGGTGLYIRALTKGLFTAPEVDRKLRSDLQQMAEQEGKQALYAILQEKDPEAASKINPNDTYRIIRALEILYQTGTPLSVHHRTHRFQEQPYEVLKIGLYRNRKELYQKIEERVDRMLDAGLLEEVKSVLKMGYPPQLKALQSIGYKQMMLYINGQISWEEAVAQMKKETKRLAKRQLTWFRHDPEIAWIKLLENRHEVSPKVKNFLNKH